MNSRPYASARLSFRGVPHCVDDFECDANPRSTGLDNAAEIFLDTKYGHVSDDGGVYTRFPATYRDHSTEIPTVEDLRSHVRGGNYTRFHMPTNIINEYPVEMNVTSYGSNSTGLQDAPQRKTQSRVKTACEGSAARRNAHAACESPLNPMQAAPLAAPKQQRYPDAVAYADRNRLRDTAEITHALCYALKQKIINSTLQPRAL